MFLREDTLPNMQRRIEYEMKCTEVPHFIIKTRTVRTEAGTERHCSSLQDTHSSMLKARYYTMCFFVLDSLTGAFFRYSKVCIIIFILEKED